MPLAEQRRRAVLAAVRGGRRARGASTSAAARARWSPTCWRTGASTGSSRVDVSARALQLAARRLRLDRLPERQRDRLQLFQSSLTYPTTGWPGSTPRC